MFADKSHCDAHVHPVLQPHVLKFHMVCCISEQKMTHKEFKAALNKATSQCRRLNHLQQLAPVETVDDVVETLRSVFAVTKNKVAQLKSVMAATNQAPSSSADQAPSSSADQAPSSSANNAIASDGKTVSDSAADCPPEIF